MSKNRFGGRRRKGSAAALAVAACVGAGAAAAQQAPLLAGQTGLSAPEGGQRLTEIDASFETAYDSNVARSGAQIAAERGLTLSDETFEPQIDAELARPIGRETVFLTGHFGYVDYAHNTVLNSEDIKVLGGAEGRVAFCDASLVGDYSRDQTDLYYLGLGPAGGTSAANIKNQFQDVGLNFAAACGHAIGFAPTVTVTQNWYTNSSPLRQALNANSTTVNGGIAYRNPVLGSINVFGQYTYTLYPNEMLATAAGVTDLDYQIAGAGISYTRAVGRRLSGTASISYVTTQPNLGLQSYSGINYGFDMAYAVTPRISAVFRFDRTTTPSQQLSFTYVLSDVYSVAVQYRMTSRINWGLGVGRSDDTYGGRTVIVPGVFSKNQLDSVYGNVDYTLSRRLRFGLSATYNHRTVDVPGLGYSEGRVAAYIRTSI